MLTKFQCALLCRCRLCLKPGNECDCADVELVNVSITPDPPTPVDECDDATINIIDCQGVEQNGIFALQANIEATPSLFTTGFYRIEGISDPSQQYNSPPMQASALLNLNTFGPASPLPFGTYRLTITLVGQCGDEKTDSIVCPNVFGPPPKTPSISITCPPPVRPWINRIQQACASFDGFPQDRIQDLNCWLSDPNYRSLFSSGTTDGDPQPNPGPVWPRTTLYQFGPTIDQRLRFLVNQNAVGSIAADSNGALLLSREAGDADRTQIIAESPCLSQRTLAPHRTPFGFQFCFSFPEGMTLDALQQEPDIQWINYGQLWASASSGSGQAPLVGHIRPNDAVGHPTGWDWVFEASNEDTNGDGQVIESVRVPYTDTEQTCHHVSYEFATDPDGQTGFYRVWLDQQLMMETSGVRFGFQDPVQPILGMYASWGVDFNSRKTIAISNYKIDRL